MKRSLIKCLVVSVACFMSFCCIEPTAMVVGGCGRFLED